MVNMATVSANIIKHGIYKFNTSKYKGFKAPYILVDVSSSEVSGNNNGTVTFSKGLPEISTPCNVFWYKSNGGSSVSAIDVNESDYIPDGQTAYELERTATNGYTLWNNKPNGAWGTSLGGMESIPVNLSMFVITSDNKAMGISWGMSVTQGGNQKGFTHSEQQGTYPIVTNNGEYNANNYNYTATFNYTEGNWYEIMYGNSNVNDNDPYTGGGGASGGGGGTGDFDDTSDIIPIPSLPSVSGLNTGFFTAFVCTQSQLRSVSDYLWTDVISDIIDTSTGLGEKVDALKKMVTSPYDAIMGCSLVPVSPPTGGSKDLKMYGVIDTGITLPYASSRWVEVDCGTLNIHEFWGSYLDYSPYTKTTSLYLPYIGVVSVDIDLIMAKALQVVYHVDILTGICIAYIVVDGSVKFQYQGHCSTTIPVTSSDYSGAIQSGLGLVGNIANVVSSGVSGGLSGGLGGATLGAVGSAISQAPSVASNVMGMKPDIKSGGGVGSSGGILGVQKPFLIIERPKQSVPAFQNGFSGYPCNMTMKLSDLSGYTEVERINLSNISLTEEEKNELLEILQSGVYL